MKSIAPQTRPAALTFLDDWASDEGEDNPVICKGLRKNQKVRVVVEGSVYVAKGTYVTPSGIVHGYGMQDGVYRWAAYSLGGKVQRYQNYSRAVCKMDEWRNIALVFNLQVAMSDRCPVPIESPTCEPGKTGWAKGGTYMFELQARGDGTVRADLRDGVYDDNGPNPFEKEIGRPDPLTIYVYEMPSSEATASR